MFRCSAECSPVGAIQHLAFSSLLYLLTLESFITTRGRSVAACSNDITVIVSNHNYIDLIGWTLQAYEALGETKVNPESQWVTTQQRESNIHAVQ